MYTLVKETGSSTGVLPPVRAVTGEDYSPTGVVDLSPRKVTRLLIVVMLNLVLASSVGSFLNHISIEGYLLREARDSFVRLFSLDGEANIPAWYSSSLLLLASMLLGIIGLAKKRLDDRYALHWGALSLIFLFLSLDEAAIIHEMSIKPLRILFHTGGLLYYAWVVPGAAAVFIVGLAYLRFLAALPARTRLLFLVAGTLFLGGSLGMESLSGQHAESYGKGNLGYHLIITIEESLEMSGVIAFLHALLCYVGSHLEQIGIRISSDQHT